MATMTPEGAFMLYYVVFPLWAVFATGILILLWILLPSPAKTLLGARFDKRCTVLFDASETGIVTVRKARREGTGLLMTNPHGSYRLIPLMPDQASLHPDEAGEPKNLSEDERKDYEMMDYAIKKRYILEGVNKPAYFGYSGKGLALPPSLVNIMDEAETDIQETEKAVKEKKAKKEPVNLGFFRKIDPRTIRNYLKYSISPAVLHTIELKSEAIGMYGRPKSTLRKIAIPIGVVMVLLVLYLIVSQGNFQLPKFGK